MDPIKVDKVFLKKEEEKCDACDAHFQISIFFSTVRLTYVFNY